MEQRDGVGEKSEQLITKKSMSLAFVLVFFNTDSTQLKITIYNYF